MNRQKIGVVAIPEIISRSWVLQDIELLRSSDSVVLPLSVPNTVPSPNVLLWFLKNFRLIISCDVFFEWFALPQIVFIAKALGKPILLNAVGGEVIVYPQFERYDLGRLMRGLLSAGLRNADSVIAISSDTAKWAGRWGAKNVKIVYEGVDTEKFCPPMEMVRADNIILTVAYLSEYNIVRKGLLTLLDSFSQVRNKIPTAKMVIVGAKLDGYRLLVQKAQKLGISGSIIFTGSLGFSHLIKFFQTASVFVMPSLQEGFPTVCCEALSCQLPVVTTNRPTMNEVFTNKKDAILVDANDTRALSDGILQVLEDRQLAKSLAINGRAMIESKYSKKIRGRELKDQISRLGSFKKEKAHSFHPMWLTIFVVCCIIFPIIFSVQSLLDKHFREKWASVVINAVKPFANR